MRRKISLLLGSGFSVSDGMKTVSQLNDRLSKIDETEIMVHSSELAVFLNGQQDNNRWMNADQRMFVQDFLQFYNDIVLKGKLKFDYEKFYDYYSKYRFGLGNKEEIENFCKVFNERHNIKNPKNSLNRIEDFNRTFNQLLASLLNNINYYDDVSTSNYPPYDNFINFLTDSSKDFDIKIHTLNHDMLIDWLGYQHSGLTGLFSDGFKLECSPYYGEVNHRYTFESREPINISYLVKLQSFCDEYDKPICLYKLHGSVQHKKIYIQKTEEPVKRIKTAYGVSKIFVESKTEAGDCKMDFLLDDVSPDVLSGKTTKIIHYKDDPYFANLFDHFKANLLSSDLLIITGYGFKDKEVNRYLKKYYLSKGKPTVIIDPSKPTSPLLNSSNIRLIQKGITQVTLNELKQTL